MIRFARILTGVSVTQPIKQPTLDFILEQTHGAVDKQLADYDTMDSKASGVFTIASAVIALAGALVAFHSSATTTVATSSGATITQGSRESWFVIGLLVAAVATYSVGALATLLGWRIRALQRADFAMSLWQEYWDDEVPDIKHMIVASIPDILATNARTIQTKANYLSIALTSTAAEVLIVGVAVVALLVG